MNNLVSDVGQSRVIMRPRINKYSGVAIIEFAIIMILFLVFVFAMFEYGFIIYDEILATNASREAARAGIRGVPVDPSYVNTLHWIGFPAAAPAISYSPTSPSSGDLVTGTVTYDYHSLLTVIFPNGSFPIRASTVMRK